ncbi:MAG: AsmA family protein [Lysobacterales bacterium]
MKLLKWLFFGVIGLVVLVVAAGLILPMVVDPNDHRERIASEASKAMGREVSLDGPMAWSVFPWIAIELNDVSVANESGFSAPHLLSVDEATVRVQLLPLVRGEIRIGDVLLRAPDVNLQVDSQGKSNWQSLVSADAGVADDSPASGDGQSLDLAVAGIQVLGARVSYSDAQADLNASISEFNLTTSAIDASQPLDVELSMMMAVEGQMNAKLQTQLEGRGLLDSSPATLAVSRLMVEGTTASTNANEPGLPFKLSLTEPLSYTEADDALSAKGLVLESGPAKVMLSVSGSAVTSERQVITGQLEIPAFNLRTWLEEAMGATFQSADEQVLSAFSTNLAFTMRPNQAALDSMTIKMDDTTVTGKADVTNLEQLAGTFSVQVDEIDVDRYLPSSDTPTQPADTATEPVNLADLDLGRLNGQIGIGSMKVAGVSASDVTLELTSGPEGVTLRPMNAGLYGGLLDTQIQLKTDGIGRLTLNQEISDVQAGPLLTDFLGTQYMTGTGDLKANLVMDDPLGANPLAGANGTVSFAFNDGAIFGMDVFGALNRAMSLLDRSSTDGEAKSEEGQTTFSSMVLEAAVNNGVLKTSQLALRSPVLNIDGNLTINLADMTVKGDITPVLLDATGLSGLDRIAGKKIPLSLSGDLSAPGISIDVGKLLLASQQDKIDEKKDELLGKLLGGDDDDPDAEGKEESDKDRAKRRLLKSLLGGDDEDDGN